MDKEIKISFPEAKLEALEFFLREENETVERVMKSYLDKIYDKTVPSQVRKFVDSRIGAQEGTAAQDEHAETAGNVQDETGNSVQTAHSHDGGGAQEDVEQEQTSGSTQTGAAGRRTTRTSTRRNSRRNTTGENQMQEAADRAANGTSETQETDQTGEQEEEPVGGMTMGM